MRTFGLEEELLLVNPETGMPWAVAERVLRRADERENDRENDRDEHDDEAKAPGGSLDGELQSQQVETDTKPTADRVELEEQVRAWRREAILSAREAGVKVVATGTSPIQVDPTLARKERYRWMAEHFGITTSQHLTCGCHVHVSVESRDEGVAVLDRVRTLTPILTAISANSPFWHGEDSGYASFRSQVMQRWPTAGPQDVYGSVRAYDAQIAAMLASGVISDQGMIYSDARLSHRYPTVELRVADVCLDARDAVLVASLARALVETAAKQWRDGVDAPAVSAALVRLETWQAGRYGLTGDLLDPHTLRPRPAREVVDGLVESVAPALEASGDLSFVQQRIDELFTHGTGSEVQRATLEKTGQLSDVVARLARVTAGQDD
ncbi:putative glutamate--cysteine ligase 2 [Pseudoclavibacter endophyticus]|uniref:Putative glutamate--cysteine ligase 2 n=1 Tax=Pseudoclavibacter endophyticus TaxID=1778590 RepID=A0A6H9WAL3_9MICO|nr:glutamate--cysteine ligase [Pseudoclavibacter endophyticus]KAB1646877.1 YbdK family carboxylate-amine ligase [Pseudoclavibacter endophyticus]GGA74775.1 putative glutamate--cysteine ligase 2 [Pseudoclavibacter endophyticus]